MPFPVPSLHAAVAMTAAADTLVAYTIPVRGAVEWATAVLVLLLLAGGVVLAGALVWLAVRLSRLLERMTASVERLSDGVAPVLAEASGIVSDARTTIGVVRQDVERLSAAASGLGEELRHLSERTGERLTRLNTSLDALQEEFERSVHTTVRTLRAVRRGARLLGRLLGARLGARQERRRSRRPPPQERRGDAG